MTNEERIKATTAILALIGIFVGFYQFIQVQAIEAAKPYLQKKLDWCEEVVEVAARIATSVAPEDSDVERFWGMYWGVMGLIENRSITDAMVTFGSELKVSQATASQTRQLESRSISIRGKSLALAHACRSELSREWSTRWAKSNRM